MTINSNFFSYISFSLQKYRAKHLNPKLVMGIVFFFSRYKLLNGQPILNLENIEYFA